MKTFVFAILAAILMTGQGIAKEKRVYKKHYVRYVEGQPYYDVYYVEDRRPYYRRFYYDDEPEFRTYHSTKRYYYHPHPHDGISIHLGF